MRFSMISLSALMLASAATPAFADDAPTAPPPAITINGSATVVSDYRFRGVSQTDKNVAIQGSITLTHESGLYVSVWGSSVDSYVTASQAGHQEVDIIGGYKKTWNGTTFDVGVLYYVYPKTKFLPGDMSSSNFFEPYFDISHTFGPVTAKATVNYAPKQKALALDQGFFSGSSAKEDNVYLAGDFSAAIPHTPVGLTAHIGHTWGPSWLATDATGSTEYTDWGLGATYTWKSLTFGVSYVDTDADFRDAYTNGKISNAGVVGTIGVSF
ncbi:TorF family putative porin [Sphingomonas oligophenolica]|uniref:TorF family putative porin n=1 Tax=Sphingomonas oligophenolica TaxID=301154 RepID=A0ABU9Y1U0_9SPHN